MQGQEFQALVDTGLLKDVEGIVLRAYLSGHPAQRPPDAYRWLRYEDPEPVTRLAEGVSRLRTAGAKFDSEAVDKAWAKGVAMGLSN